ncbi:MAG TPA: DUF6089 family protein [Chitinophagaceae bacterium]
MKEYSVFVVLLLATLIAPAQRVHIGVFGGLAAYNGDLTENIFPKKVTNGAVGITVNYELKDQVILRGGLTYAIVGGADRFSDKPDLVVRNLSFETSLFEFSLLGEYYFFNLYDQRVSPYVFAGLAVYHFDPYAYNNGNKIYLKPLSTEGQGLAGYPDRKSYGLTQLAIPFGGGVKYAISNNLRVGIEVGIRKLFTDYLDDVSTAYIDPNDLLAAKGQLAVDMSYRGDELPNGNPGYPAKGDIRGGAKKKDMYYFTGIHLTYRLGEGGANKRKYGCPSVPL